MGICVAMDSVVMATNNYADVQEVEKDEGEGRAGGDEGSWRKFNLNVVEIQL